MPTPPTLSMPGLSVQRDGTRVITRALPDEVPVAMVFDGGTQAVLMATPTEVEDFARGFALSEGIVEDLSQIRDLEVVPHGHGIEARMWLAEDRSEALKARRRSMLGPVGCGLCGIDSLDQALRALPVLPMDGAMLNARETGGATEALSGWQPLHDQTRAVHAAGFLQPGRGIIMAREDVGRHNALDKLIGALAQAAIAPSSGAMVLTSRVSVEMVQKTVMAGCPILIAVSAPTVRALTEARAACLTVAAFARGGGFDIYSCPERIQDGESDVA